MSPKEGSNWTGKAEIGANESETASDSDRTVYFDATESEIRFNFGQQTRIPKQTNPKQTIPKQKSIHTPWIIPKTINSE
ncbi:hypothetical protein ACE38V_19430 [Cytobacillus sp. Hz8]|uniref:hypothetical protein n=1 Tax=Cytobacillus sp. Hz8 TaxID=3347168 RepID=UPI0035DF102E